MSLSINQQINEGTDSMVISTAEIFMIWGLWRPAGRRRRIQSCLHSLSTSKNRYEQNWGGTKIICGEVLRAYFLKAENICKEL